MSSKALLVQGTTLQISTQEATSTAPTGLTMADLDCTARQLQWQGGQATEHDTSTLCSTAKEFRLGLSDSGTLSVTGFWKSDDSAQKAIKAADKDKKPRLIVVTFPDRSKFTCLALVQQRSWDAQVDGVVGATFNFRITGEVEETEPPAGP